MDAVSRMALIMAALFPMLPRERRPQVRIITEPPPAFHSQPPANDDPPPAPVVRVRDLEEDARFRAEIERDERLGSHADWPDV